MIKLRVFRWDIILDYPGRPDVITRVFIKERKECQSQRRCDDRIVGAEVRGHRGPRPLSKEYGQTLEAGKDKKMDTTPKTLEGTQPY